MTRNLNILNNRSSKFEEIKPISKYKYYLKKFEPTRIVQSHEAVEIAVPSGLVFKHEIRLS